jgi:hypothetical protein
MNGEQIIHGLVRDVLNANPNDDGFWGPVEPTDNSEIRSRLVELGGGKDFPDENAPGRSAMRHYLIDLFKEYGTDRVLATIKELGEELEKMQLELPSYYRSGPNSQFDQALQVANEYESQWTRDREERR